MNEDQGAGKDPLDTAEEDQGVGKDPFYTAGDAEDVMPTPEEFKGVLQDPWMESAPNNEINSLLPRFVEERREAIRFDEINRVQQQRDKQVAAMLPLMFSGAVRTKAIGDGVSGAS